MVDTSVANIKIGDIYWDCSYHPVLCTEINHDDDTMGGVSLFDGSSPRSCSIQHCGAELLSVKQLQILIQMRDDFLLAEKFFRSTQVNNFYTTLLAYLNDKTDFRK